MDDKQQNFYKRLLINIWVKFLKQGIKKSEVCLKQGRKISDICLKQGQGMRGRDFIPCTSPPREISSTPRAPQPFFGMAINQSINHGLPRNRV